MEKVTIKSTKKAVATAQEERWRNSSIHPELSVSDRGRVRAREYQLVTPIANGSGFRIYNVPAKMLDAKMGQSGEVFVNFTNASGVAFTENVALMVATEFVPNEDPSRYTKLKFRDLNRANINASNLYWDGVGIYAKK